MAGLPHLARLNDHWFKLDEPLISAFVERWCSQSHTFHLPFSEYTVTLQDVAYQLWLLINGQYISECLTEFERYIEGGRPVWTWFEELLDVMPPLDCIDKFTVKCTWMQHMFSDLPEGVDGETVRRYARVYIMMLLSMQLFSDKSSTHMHIRWLLYVVVLLNTATLPGIVICTPSTHCGNLLYESSQFL
ncbi:protein MAIN-LIKE 2-like [Arachis stenosperma]|uniref:protein MAIN-LIKE 2-like n=1 Tax=Arachis stenosperma TaxID=217475 RepID=UPI0025ABF7ED|nr:protein MAIN-LIKE 2-like [Arachis stenosperma]